MANSDFLWDPSDPLARCEGETRKAHDALHDYWLMGPGRSLRKLVRQYRQRANSEATKTVPASGLSSLNKWSVRYCWQARIDRAKEIFDDRIVQKELEAYRDRVLSSGYALYYERIASLQRLAALLEEEIYEEKKRWLPDVKQIGSGDQAERVDIERFNAPLIEQFRRLLDDIAGELGERVKGLELRGGLGIVSITPDELAKARHKARALEKQLLGDDE